MIYDEEDLMRAMRTHLKNNLNARIQAINSEKGDTLLDTIAADDKHFIIAGELLEIPNHAFCQVALAGDVEIRNNHDDLISVPRFLCEVAFDNPKKPGTYFKSLRYMRAIYETMADFESAAIEADGMQLSKATPMIAAHIKRELVISGVEVSLAIG